MRSRLITQIAENIDPLQYAREGHSTADTLIYFLQPIHEASDTRGNVPRGYLLPTSARSLILLIITYS